MPPHLLSAEAQAYNFILKNVREGVLKAGTRIRPQQIAEEIGISRMPVREAIRALQAEGFLTAKPNRSSVVTPFTPEDIQELFELRSVLEGLAGRVAVPEFDENAIDELSHIVDQMERASNKVDLWIKHHNQFHDLLCRQSRRPRLTLETERLRTAIEPYLRLWYSERAIPAIVISEHRDLVEAIRRRDGLYLEVTLRDHVLSTAVALIDWLREQGARAANG